MARISLRVRVDEIGRLEIVDPGLDSLSLLRDIDPAFEVRAEELPNFTVPRFQRLRALVTDMSMREAVAAPVDALWAVHDGATSLLNKASLTRAGRGASLLEIKALIATRLLAACTLCARRCMVDRTRGEMGPCGLGEHAFAAEHFVHIAEEAPINPSLILNLRGCALRCRFCQQHALLDAEGYREEVLEASLWNRIDVEGARSVSFVGGNPDESMHAIFEFLDAAPPQWALPVVWNNHAYMSDEGIRLLDGVVDCYVPDLKYMDSTCGLRLSGVPRYPETAKPAIQALLRQDVPVMVRILVLPGHSACCHLPSLHWLAEQEQANLYVSVRGQYAPDWRITQDDGLLTRRPTRGEVDTITATARGLGLRLINSGTQ